MQKTLIALGLGAGLAASPLMAENRIDTIRPDAPELAAVGNYPIGVQTMEFTNHGQIDILNVSEGEEPTYDRPLTVEIWYPAAEGTSQGDGTYNTRIRDGVTDTVLKGRAARDAAPASGETFPLIVISHGYPGNRMLMSHLGENLATKGYVTVSIDHTDSTYSDKAAFGSTLLNRPIDQRFVIDQMAGLEGPLGEIVDADTTGVIGYSMGGYGAIITAGGGVTEASVGYTWGGPHGTLGIYQAGSETHEALADPRIKTAVAIGPWGMNTGFWDAEGLAGIRLPMLFIAGSDDDVSGYEKGTRAIFEGAVNTDRYLLTFQFADHNAAAPMPAPAESWEP